MADHLTNDQIKYKEICKKYKIPIQQRVLEALNKEELSIKNRSLGSNGIKAIAVSLTVSKCKFCNFILIFYRQTNTTVRRLDLEGNGAEIGGVCGLCEMLMDNAYILYLNLSCNNIDDFSALAIGGVLNENEILEELHLSDNRLSDVAVSYLCNGLKRNTSLKFLNLSKNEISDVGALHLAKCLADNTSLLKLNLSWNWIGGKGAVVLCKSLRENQLLDDIDFSSNGFGYDGALAVRELLKANKTIRKLNLASNRINWNGALFISEGLKLNSTLECLDLSDNPITTTGCLDIIEGVAESNIKELNLGKIPVIGEFQIMVMFIRQKRHLSIQHGGTVRSHDVLGQRFQRRVDPMQRIIDYMKEKQLRPTEMFRNFDKQVSKTITVDTFFERLKRCGIHMHKFEVAELMLKIQKSVKDEKHIDNKINYKKMARSVQEHLESERQERINKREAETRLERYHEKLLKPKLRESDIEKKKSNLLLPVTVIQTKDGDLPQLINNSLAITRKVELLGENKKVIRSSCGVSDSGLRTISIRGQKKKKDGKKFKKKRKIVGM